MGRKLPIGFGIALSIGAAALAWRSVERDSPRTADPASPGTRASLASKSASSRGSGSKPPTGPARPASHRLAALIDAPPSTALNFQEVESLSSQLSDDETSALLEEVRSHPPDSIGAWIRCAFFAERARRDPAAAMAYLNGDQLLNYDGFGIQQAWFSTFRGWAEVDPKAAAAKLAEFIGPANRTGKLVDGETGCTPETYHRFLRQADWWKREAYSEVFAHLAGLGVDAAWELLPDLDQSGVRICAIEGLFRGAGNREELDRLLARWEPEWRVAKQAERSELQSINPDLTDPSSIGRPRLINPGSFPNQEDLAIQAALALAQTNPEAAARWLQSAGPSDAESRGNRERLFYNELAQRAPAAVVALLESGSDQDAFLLTALVQAHPERASEFLPLVASTDLRSGALTMAITGQCGLYLADLFPAPRRPNRLPNYEERYDGLLEAVNGAGLPPDLVRNLAGALHQEFAAVLPKASNPAP